MAARRSVAVTVRKQNFASAFTKETSLSALAPGEVCVAVRKWAYTANNVTYALAGKSLNYWDFFPCSDTELGCVPVWGTAEVIESRADDLNVGSRLYGFLPMAEHAVMTPSKVSKAGFTDVAEHRAALPSIYNRYTLLSHDPFFTPATEDRMLLLRPLYLTSWLLYDFLKSHGYFGAQSVLLTSASSKTAIGLAHELQRHAPHVMTVGLTSARNRAMVEHLGLYSTVVTYEELLSDGGALDGTPAVLVDMAGSARVLTAVHALYAEQLKHSCQVGLSHVAEAATTQGRPPQGLAGPKPKFFFAPAWIERRAAEATGGVGELMASIMPAWHAFVADSERWLSVSHACGQEAVLRAHAQTVAGESSPNVGTIMSLAPSPVAAKL
jgi:hypothetical protein